jgi:hypothetical protein
VVGRDRAAVPAPILTRELKRGRSGQLVSLGDKAERFAIADLRHAPDSARATSFEVDVHPIEDVADLQRLMVGEALGGPMRVLVWRDGDVRAITVEPAELEAA